MACSATEREGTIRDVAVSTGMFMRDVGSPDGARGGRACARKAATAEAADPPRAGVQRETSLPNQSEADGLAGRPPRGIRSVVAARRRATPERRVGLDPLDTAFDVILDQAFSVRVQLLAATPARAAIVRVHSDPDALAATLSTLIERGRDALFVRIRGQRADAYARERVREVAKAARQWLARLHLAFLIVEGSREAARVDAVAEVRDAIPTDRRSVVRAHAALVAALEALRQQQAAFAGLALLDELVAEGEGVRREFDAQRDAAAQTATQRRGEVRDANAARAALLDHLREIRREWAMAESMSERSIPSLDLRICKGYVANRRPRVDRGEPAVAEPAGGAGAPAAEASGPTAEVAADVQAEPAAADTGAVGCEAADATGTTVRVIAEVRTGAARGDPPPIGAGS